jgi:hypothetical protein
MQRYMHLSPAALDTAIPLFEAGTETSRMAVEKFIAHPPSVAMPPTGAQ